MKHTHIISIIDYGDDEGYPYLVMPYLPGGTLKEKLRDEGKVNWQDAAHLLLPVAKGLAYAHEEEMVHRDVKPANILITRSGDPMLTDFGIAKIIDEEATMDLTGTRATVGTPEYMAPEQVTAKTVDHRADIYALGVVFYEMVTGRKPFQADTPMAVLVKLSSEPLPRPTEFTPKLPKSVEQVLLKALAKDPNNRYQNMRELIVALEKLLQGKATPAKPVRKRVTEKRISQEEKLTSTFQFPIKYIWLILGGAVVVSILLGWLMGGGAEKAFPAETLYPAYTPTLEKHFPTEIPATVQAQLLNIENDIRLVRLKSTSSGFGITVEYSYNGEYGDRVNLLGEVREITCSLFAISPITPQISNTNTGATSGCVGSLEDGEMYTVVTWMSAAGHGTFFEKTFTYQYNE